MKILIINGPNLNKLGEREPSIYGKETMQNCLEKWQRAYPKIELTYFQSNVEGYLIDRIQQAEKDGTAGIVFNAGAYTHTSVALHDCIRSVSVPVVEIHISNVLAREEFRHTSLIAAACKGSIAGFGMNSYRLGIESFLMG